MDIREINSQIELEGIREDWHRLYEQCPWATPFQSPDWILPWWRYLGGGDLLILAAYSEGRLAGIAPLYLHANGDSQSELLFLGTGVSDYLDFICEPESADVVVPGLIRYLLNLTDRWHACNFQELRRESAILTADPSSYSGFSLSQIGVCPVLSLPRTPEDYRSLLGATLRRTLNQTMKRVERSCIHKAAQEDVPGFMDSLFLLHRKRWEGKSLPGVLDRPEVQSFHREVSSLFAARGSLELHAMRYREDIAAVLYGFRKGRRFYAYLSGFDPELNALSPGAFLIYSVIEDTIRSGLCEFDFLRGAEPYKYGWGAKDTPNFQLRFARG